MKCVWSQRLLPALLAAVVFPLSAAAQQARPFIDPALKRLLGPDLRQVTVPSGRFDVLPTNAPLPMSDRLAVERNAAGRPEVGVFFSVSDQAAVNALRSRGARIGNVARAADGRILLTARIPLDLADSALHAPGVLSAHAARKVKVFNDSSVHAIHADEVRQRVGSTWTGSAGQGVIVGIYDTGIDFTHRDFIDADGHTRILGLWDQTLAGSPPNFGGFTNGTYCTQAMIQSAIGGTALACPEQDIHGHGTHVAGTAAGNGSSVATGANAYGFAGVAPAADLLIVKGGNGSFYTDQIIQGLAWIDSMSLRLRKPAVVNLSLGGLYGPRDGTNPEELQIDAMARPGFVVAVAAGNDGSNNNMRTPGTNYYFHASQALTSGQTGALNFSIIPFTPFGGVCANKQTFEAWYGGSDKYTVTIVRPDGSSVTAGADTLARGDGPNGFVYIDNASSGVDPSDGDKQLYVEISDCGTSGAEPAPGTWTVQLTAQSVTSSKGFNLWLDQDGGLGGVYATGAAGFDDRMTLGSPAGARSVITVGAFATKIVWPTPTGDHRYTNPPAQGDLAPFSSSGPSRDGRVKPEITAPGMGVMSALSKAEPKTDISPLLISTDSLHQLMAGTSMATPAVTGAIALILQAKPQFTSTDVRNLLMASATQDAFTSRTYGTVGTARDWWGAGKLNVKAALGALGGNPLAVASVTLTTHADTLVRNATDRFAVVVANALGVPLDSAASWSSSNPAVATVDASGLVRAVAAGNAWISAAVGSRSDSAAVVVVAPSTLVLTGTSVSPGHATLAREGTRLPLLALNLKSSGYEAMKVTSLAFDVHGADPGARVILVRDLDRSGTIGTNEPQIASMPAALTAGQTTRINFTLDSLTIAANDSIAVLVGVLLSGQAPNLTGFSATLVPSAVHTLGVRSQAADQIGSGAATIASSTAATTVLTADENFALSENPVRHGHVIFNFSQRPTVAAVYSLTGRRVADLLKQMTTDGSVDWALKNDDGGTVANGIYLVVFDVGGQVIRQKLFIARPQE